MLFIFVWLDFNFIVGFFYAKGEKRVITNNVITIILELILFYDLLMSKGSNIFPIPSTKQRTYIKENIQSLEINLTIDELQRINNVTKMVQGNRKNDFGMKLLNQ